MDHEGSFSAKNLVNVLGLGVLSTIALAGLILFLVKIVV
jgi:hypothetical protein